MRLLPTEGRRSRGCRLYNEPLDVDTPIRASLMTDVTRLLSAIEQADPSAAEALLPLLHRRQASIQPIGENEMPIVSVGKGSITGQTQVGGTTWYEWTFPVVVDGQAGVYSLMDQSNDPADEPALENTVNTILQQNRGRWEGSQIMAGTRVTMMVMAPSPAMTVAMPATPSDRACHKFP